MGLIENFCFMLYSEDARLHEVKIEKEDALLENRFEQFPVAATDLPGCSNVEIGKETPSKG